MSQIRLFLQIYTRPLRAFGPVIDEARLAFAVGIALLAVFAVQAPRFTQYRRITAEALRYARAHPAPPAPAEDTSAEAAPPRPEAGGTAAKAKGKAGADEDDAYDEYTSSLLSMFGPMPLGSAVNEFIGFSPFHYFPPLLAMAACFVPAAILIVTLLQGLGRFTNVLFRDYLALLVCALLAWAAAYLPLGIVNFALSYLHPAWHNAPALWWGASLYFLALSACALRTLMGASVVHGAGAAAGAWAAGVAGVWMHSIMGNITWYLASPCVLYYLWANLQGSFHTIGYGLSARQRMKRNLESLTINPRDADAHCQLGLIYLQRRQYEPAAERFRKAIEIDASEPEPWYQLGRIARLEGRYDEALLNCQTAVRLDDKHSGSEVWRELGVVQYLSGRPEAARYALEQYTQRREYDPEGQCWYGRVLAALGEPEDARRAFQNAIEAVRTMPSPRKHQVRSWAAEANKELRALPKGADTKATRNAAAELRPETNRLSHQDQTLH